MKYHELKVSSAKKSKRVGRGIAAGRGKTAGRGTKGQGARTGSSAKPGFAGGSNPLMQKLPKLPGFRSHRTPAETVYTGQLDKLSGNTVDAEALKRAGLVKSQYSNIKLLVKGELSKKILVKLPSASSNAIAAVEASGGSFEVVKRLSRPKTSQKPSKSTKSSESPDKD
jgi:large subunit ribosomal protein L15